MTSDRELFEAALAKEYGPRWRLVMRSADPMVVSWEVWQAARRAEGADKLHDAIARDLLRELIILRDQIHQFAVQFGEADFYTGGASEAIKNALPVFGHAAAELAAGCTQGEVEKNAARYLWLRNCVLVDGEINGELYVGVDSPSWPGNWALVGNDLDRAVDAAIGIGGSHG